MKKVRKNKHTTWIVLYSHYPLHSWGFSHIPTWQSHIQPLVDKYQVDLYLAGHRHVYERHKPIRRKEIFDDGKDHIYSGPKGTKYITNGSCGGSLQGVGGLDMPSMIFTPAEKMYTYAVMSIAGKNLRYEVFDKWGHQVDYFTIYK